MRMPKNGWLNYPGKYLLLVITRVAPPWLKKLQTSTGSTEETGRVRKGKREVRAKRKEQSVAQFGTTNQSKN